MKEGWVKKKLGEVCETSSGGTPTKSRSEFYENGNIPWLRSGELNKKYILDSELHITELGMEKSSAKLFPINTVVIAMYGATVGQVSILKKEMTTNQAICGILPNKTSTPEYLYYFLKSKKDAFVKDAVGGAQPNISQNLIKSTYLLYPPLPEQQQIVAELDCLQGIIDKKKEQLQELDKLAQSIFYTMFGDPVENEKGWKKCSLNKLCTITSSKRIFASEYTTLGIPFYRGKEISEKAFSKEVTTELFISEDRYKELKEKFGVPQTGDILLTAVGTIGNMWVVDNKEPFYYKDGNILCLHINDNINSIYFKSLLSILINEYKKTNANGCAYNALTIVNLKKMQTNIIPLPLQQEFADKISAIEQQKARIQQSLQDTETLFQSRMDYYFG